MQFLKMCIEAESVIQYVFISSIELITQIGKALKVECLLYFE